MFVAPKEDRKQIQLNYFNIEGGDTLDPLPSHGVEPNVDVLLQNCNTRAKNTVNLLLFFIINHQ